MTEIVFTGLISLHRTPQRQNYALRVVLLCDIIMKLCQSVHGIIFFKIYLLVHIPN